MSSLVGAILSVIGKAVNEFMGPNGEVLKELEGEDGDALSTQSMSGKYPTITNHNHTERCIAEREKGLCLSDVGTLLWISYPHQFLSNLINCFVESKQLLSKEINNIYVYIQHV